MISQSPEPGPLRLRCLGGLAVEAQGRSLGPAASQQRRMTLLACIAAAGPKGVSRERLLALFWPESDDARARTALNQSLYALRRDLACENLLSGTTHLALDVGALQSDVTAFQGAIARRDWRAAVGAYGGDFLEGVRPGDSAELDAWLETTRGELRRSFLDALTALADQAAGAERIELLRRLSIDDPLNSRHVRALVDALASDGELAQAICIARDHQNRLTTELGVPDQELAALVERLRRKVAAVAPTQHGHSVDRMEPVASPLPSHASHPGMPAPTPVGGSRGQRGFSAIAGAALLTLVLVGVALTQRDATDKSLYVVVPFDNHTGDSANDVTGQMVADWITHGLTNARIVEAVAASTMIHAAIDSAHRPRAPIAIGQATRASNVVHGALYRKGDSIHVNARVLRTSDGAVLQDLAPVVVPADSTTLLLERTNQAVLGAIAIMTDSRWEPIAGAMSGPPSLAAYEAFVQGLHVYVSDRPRNAFPHFVRAARLDTMFVAPKLMAAEVTDIGGTQEMRRVADSLVDAAARLRERLTPFDQASVDRRVAIRKNDLESAWQASKRRLAIAPRSPEVQLTHGHLSVATNRFEEASRVLHALDLRQVWFANISFVREHDVRAHHMRGDLRGAIAELDKVRDSFPLDFGACMRSVAEIGAAGDVRALDRRVAECHAMPTAPPPDQRDASGYFNAGVEMLQHGHSAAARHALERELKFRLEVVARHPERPVRIAQVHYALERFPEAYARLRLEMPDSSFNGRATRAIYAAHAGDSAVARAAERWLADSSADRPLASTLYRARIATALGERERAIGLLRESLKHGLSPAHALHAQLDFRPLWNDRRFQELLRPRR